MKQILVLVFIILSVTCLSFLVGQKKTIYPEVGKKCSDYFFHEIQYYRATSASISELKGKWLVLDCWNRYCTSCTNAFPHTDSLARQFSATATILLVGYTGHQYSSVMYHPSDDSAIHHMYDSLRLTEHLSLPIAYDSSFFHLNDIGGCPYVIIIDPQGIVRAITDTFSASNLTDLFNGGSPKLEKVYRTHEPGSAWMRYHPNYHSDSQ